MEFGLNYFNNEKLKLNLHRFKLPKKKKKPRNYRKDCRRKIKRLDITNESLSSRAGLAPYVNFLNGSRLADEFEYILSHLRKSSKGI